MILIPVALSPTLYTQVRARWLVAARRWLMVILIGIVGRLITDNQVDTVGLPLGSTAIVAPVPGALPGPDRTASAVAR